MKSSLLRINRITSVDSSGTVAYRTINHVQSDPPGQKPESNLDKHVADAFDEGTETEHDKNLMTTAKSSP